MYIYIHNGSVGKLGITLGQMFQMTDHLTGLVCSGCGLKSEKPLREIRSYPNDSCHYQEERKSADGIEMLEFQQLISVAHGDSSE